MPKVSVIIPLYNCASFISATIESVLAQTYKDFEIIAIDDGSADNTYELITSRYGDKVKCSRQENLGLSLTRNKAISLASGEYIAFIDHDDKWLPNKLERELEVFKNKPEVGLVFSDAYITNTEGKRVNRFFKIVKPHRGQVFRDLLKDNFIPILTVVVKKEVLDKTALFNPKYKIAEDWELFLKVAQLTQVEYLDMPLAEYMVHQRSFSNNRKLLFRECKDLLNSYFISADEQTKALLKKSISLYDLGLGLAYLQDKDTIKAKEYFYNSIRGYPFCLRAYLIYLGLFMPEFIRERLAGVLRRKDIHE